MNTIFLLTLLINILSPDGTRECTLIIINIFTLPLPASNVTNTAKSIITAGFIKNSKWTCSNVNSITNGTAKTFRKIKTISTTEDNSSLYYQLVGVLYIMHQETCVLVLQFTL